MATKRATGPKPVATNRKARHDYDVIDTFECGIVLVGSEVKSLRDGKAQLQTGGRAGDGLSGQERKDGLSGQERKDGLSGQERKDGLSGPSTELIVTAGRYTGDARQRHLTRGCQVSTSVVETGEASRGL